MTPETSSHSKHLSALEQEAVEIGAGKMGEIKKALFRLHHWALVAQDTIGLKEGMFRIKVVPAQRGEIRETHLFWHDTEDFSVTVYGDFASRGVHFDRAKFILLDEGVAVRPLALDGQPLDWQFGRERKKRIFKAFWQFFNQEAEVIFQTKIKGEWRSVGLLEGRIDSLRDWGRRVGGVGI